ncbi:MAG: bifunctional phosphopantothenoylcysteine decarboxylase/phosphopantothenate--cysteine ligase CoaBC [Thermodesulfobacteriota bacterium]|nr:bifunctional phosphopantothenoylcysteine decarboxylase/phosphopantothenate--cysteine ligase CoaBC [Thermodesulfobacteriota bacterium]
MIKGKRIVLGVTGGIAAYKSAELTREFVKKGADVRVIMTKSAEEFITPLTMKTLSGNPVYDDTFLVSEEGDIAHINLAQTADIIVIAPATANIIGKMASGIADDLLSTTVIATKAPVLICPAMNANMYENSIVTSNMERLSQVGYYFAEVAYGELACKTEGPGRLPPLRDIVEKVESILTDKDLEGEKIVVTAGPTREPIDPVRYISNYSSGKMGYALSICARRRGADVTLVSGPTSLDIPADIEFIEVSTAQEMRDAVMKELENATVIIKAAAVADYRPKSVSESKIKKGEGKKNISLDKTPDIISEIGDMKGDRILVGFAMETEDIIVNARRKLKDKKMDLVVANDLSEEGSGFQHDTNVVKIIDSEGNMEELPLMDKMEVSDRILHRVKKICDERK